MQTCQSELNFSTESPINQVKLTGQNQAIYQLLRNSESITLFDAINIGVWHLHSRIAEVSKVVTVYRRMITKNGSQVKEYSLKPFNL